MTLTASIDIYTIGQRAWNSAKNIFKSGNSKFDLQFFGQKGLGGKGWVGDANWRKALRTIGEAGKNSTIQSINGYIPTQQEAVELIKQAGGTILRIDSAHQGGLSTHIYPHINYLTSQGVRATLRILKIE